MTEQLNQSTQESGEELSFAELFEMEENSTVVAVGDVAIGTIIGTEDDYFLVDVGDMPTAHATHSDDGPGQLFTGRSEASAAQEMPGHHLNGG